MSRAHYPSQGQSGRRPLSLTLLGPLSAAIHPFLTSAYPQGPPGGKCKPSAHTDNMVQGHLSVLLRTPGPERGQAAAQCPLPCPQSSTHRDGAWFFQAPWAQEETKEPFVLAKAAE